MSFVVQYVIMSSMNRMIVPAAMALLIAALALSFSRNRIYEDEVTVWADTVEKSPAKARPHNNYGYALKEAHRLEEARRQFEWAIAIKPDYADALNNLATIYGNIGRRSDAYTILVQVLQIDPGHLQARSNLALSHYESGRLNEAVREYNVILSIAPLSKEAAFARSMLGMIMKQRSP